MHSSRESMQLEISTLRCRGRVLEKELVKRIEKNPQNC